MSFVIATPDLVQSAAGDLAAIRSSLAEASTTVAGPTTGIAAAAQDEVSIAVASMFGNVGQEFQALSMQAQAFHQHFVSLVNASAGAYVAAEAANAGQVALGGGVFGNVEQSISGALSGAGSTFGQVGQSVGGTLIALGNGGLGAAVAGQIQADVNAVSSAIAGAPAGVSAAIQTGGQAISQAVGGFQAQLGALVTGGFPGLVNSAGVFGASIVGPYQALVTNTVTNLQAIANTFVSNPFPFLHQFVNNQVFYAQSIAGAIGTGIANLPAELANLPATIQAALQGLSTFNPGALLQQFINNQIGYAQTLITAPIAAARDLGTGLLGLPAAFQAAGQALLAGNFQGAVNAVAQGLENVVLPGFQEVFIPLADLGLPGEFPITPLGPLGDLAPIFAIPGQMAQNFTNLLPAGSIPALMAQNFTNLVDAFTNFGSSLNSADLGISFGLPLQLLFDGIGAPASALSALNSSAVAFVGALQTGNVSAALASVLDAPAAVANGFLNGQALLNLPPLTVNVGNLLVTTTTASLPLGGLFTPLSPVVSDVLGPLAGTQIGGIIPALLDFRSQLALAIALPSPVLPSFVF
ncbi:PE family protein [Mycobacterium parmense]|uniref:PE family protein n=1 Tax=Mycobacterium parmense TaxID=185642 RepID=A0A7I7YTC6_9MYCO|nr:PE family protein [Mycobacterium parmense]MCV7348871.1 PE family protein [Mycobacterium parmense]BBZ44384.1 PE family protein [Mycobacterium parmense]